MSRVRTPVIVCTVIVVGAIVLVASQIGGRSPAAGDGPESPTAASQSNDDRTTKINDKASAETSPTSTQTIAGLTLHGTMVTGADGAGIAFLSEGQDAATVRYEVDDALPGGGTMVAVRDRSIDVRTDAGIETLTLDFKSSGVMGSSRNASAGVDMIENNPSLEAAMQEARGDDVPPEEPPINVEAVIAPTAEDRRREEAIELAIDRD